MPQAHKEIIRRYVDELNRRNFSILDEVVAEDVVLRSLLRTADPDQPDLVGRAAMRQAIQERIAAFPDYHVTILEMLADNDQVMLYWRNRGTHQGQFLGVPPTGKLIEEVVITLYRLHDGRIVEVRGLWDQADTWQQLGLIPGADEIEQRIQSSPAFRTEK